LKAWTSLAFAQSNKRGWLKTSRSRSGQTGLPTPRATPFLNERFQAKLVTISPVLPTPTNPARVSIFFREKLFKAVEPLLASSVLLKVGGKQLLFSGDLGDQDDLLMNSPDHAKAAKRSLFILPAAISFTRPRACYLIWLALSL
jgi:hypothetical protein